MLLAWALVVGIQVVGGNCLIDIDTLKIEAT